MLTIAKDLNQTLSPGSKLVSLCTIFSKILNGSSAEVLEEGGGGGGRRGVGANTLEEKFSNIKAKGNLNLQT